MIAAAVTRRRDSTWQITKNIVMKFYALLHNDKIVHGLSKANVVSYQVSHDKIDGYT